MQLVGYYKFKLILPFPSYRFLQAQTFEEIGPPAPLEIDGLLKFRFHVNIPYIPYVLGISLRNVTNASDQ